MTFSPFMRRLLFITVSIIATWTAVWFGAAHVTMTQAMDWLDTQAGQPSRVSCDSALTRSGFPGLIHIGCERPRGIAPGVVWRGAPVFVVVRPWDWNTWSFRMPGQHRITGPDGDMTVDAKTLDGTIDVSEAQTPHLSLSAAGLIGSGWTAQSANLVLTQNLRADPVLSAGFRASLTNLVLPEKAAIASQLGNRFEQISAEGTVTGPLDLRGWPPKAVALAQWRDDGGIVDIDAVVIKKGALALSGDGTLALDGLLQPQGAFGLHVTGYNETLNAMAARGVVAPGDAALIGFVLGALPSTPSDDGRPTIQIPLTVQDGGVFIGPVRIARLTAIRWPE